MLCTCHIDDMHQHGITHALWKVLQLTVWQLLSKCVLKQSAIHSPSIPIYYQKEVYLK